ncbi:MAG: SUMF1/EgtB/PvdO family nonheme iron enzyme, partial [Planctomycetota bacterium]
MGEVWEAQQLSMSRRVALKFVRPERVTPHQLDLFAREARAGGRLSHAGIVTIYGHGEANGRAWIAMELVAGACTLKNFLDDAVRGVELPQGYDQNVARLVAEVAEALQAAHAAGVIHRDVKPQNVLLTADDRPKVTDFGLARITDEAALSQTGEFAGTYLYMSPEQAMARRMGLDHRTDVFSLGVVLYELLTLRRPFEGDTTHQVAEQILYRDPPDPRTIRSRIPRDLAVIAGKALEKERDKRYATMQELAADLRRHLADEPIHATPPTRVDRAVKWMKRNPGKSSAAAIVAVTFTVIAMLLVANVRTNRALVLKTNEAEANATEARDQAQTATARADDVLRLSALQRLEDLTSEADELWPAFPENVPKYEAWLKRAQALVDELPQHEKKLGELRAEALPWTPEMQAQQRASHPRLKELESIQRHLAYLRLFAAAEPPKEASAAALGIDSSALPKDANGINDLAWPLVDPERKDWGGEAKGLALARKAIELASSLSAPERAGIRDTLAWALFANARFDDAVWEEEQAVDEVGAEQKKEFEGKVEELKKAIDERISTEGLEAEAKLVAELEAQASKLETEVSQRPEWLFADAEDTWWHNQLDKLVSGIHAFADEKTGLFSSGTSEEHGWGMKKRLGSATSIAEQSVTGTAAAQRWSAAIASIANTAECPQYGGLRISAQLGLLPIGRDLQSGLWEFAHLQTGEPGERDADGKVVLKDETGIVFVLLPGGTFTMGAQAKNPSGPNYDPQAQSDEGPPHEVTLSPFFMSKYEMTQGQWLRFVGKNPSAYGPREYDSLWNRSGVKGDLVHPVEQVSGATCMGAMNRLGLELPSEAQWEYGARGGTTTIWWCGAEKESILPAGNLADGYCRNHGGSTVGHWEQWDDGNTTHARVGSYLPSPFGLHDVIGNVWECCRDGYDSGFYRRGPKQNPVADPAGSSVRVNRGGGFDNLAVFARSASRFTTAPELAPTDLGLRPAMGITTRILTTSPSSGR